MKKILLLASLVLTSIIFTAQADVPPPAGYTSSVEISGAEAGILYDYLDEKEQNFPKEIGKFVKEGPGLQGPGDQVYTKGRVGKKTDRNSTITIGCVSFYRGAMCKLVQKYK